MHKRCRALLALCALALPGTLLPSQGHASLADQLGLSPYWNWKTIETEHFRVTFPADLEEAAQKEAGFLEEAHAVLSPKLYWQPWHRTQVLVIDNADMANGLTSPVLRLGLVLWVTPPDPWFSTTYYDDWLRLLAFHEYTHLLNMDNVQDFYVPLRYIMGDVILPNSAWPPWMLEGLAVYMETRFTRAGRGRSPYFEMLIRTAVDENTFDTPDFYTLDKINGDAPYVPAGEVPYFFGYELMNQVARTPVMGGRTADGMGALSDGEDALGVMSRRSAARVPFFINGNLENITGKDWYSYWDQWVTEARARASAQLARIRSRPVTELERLTPSKGIETFGPAPSPNGTWLAYTSDTPDRRSGLYLMDLIGGKIRRVTDKNAGATSAFTPDSRTLVYSAVERQRIYYQLSDLMAYDLERDRTYALSHGLRARDPDVSPDGLQIVFTLTENQTTGLALAQLARDPASGELKLGAVRKLVGAASRYDRVATPRFSRDGKHVYYSLHHNGRPSEELMAWELASSSSTELVSNGKFNRYPAPAQDGSVYFVSDLSGADNLYRLPPGGGPGTKPELFSNVTGGLSTPVVGAQGELYAAAYSAHGWGIARVPPLKAPVKAQEVTIDPPPAPRADQQSEDHSRAQRYEVSDYSLFPSILPREWLILPQIYAGGVYVQADVAGFDAVDRHEYQGAVGYNTQIPKVDWSAVYANRVLGPTLSLGAADRTTNFGFNDLGVTSYTRKQTYAAELSYLIPWTYSSLEPAIAVGGERIFSYYRGANPANDDLVGSSPFVPTADVSFSYSSAETSRLAISPEDGRVLTGGARVYSDTSNSQVIWKGVLKDAEYFRIADHAVLSPSIKAMWTSGFDYNFGNADAVVQGRTPGLLPTSLDATFDPLLIRGYPEAVFFSRASGVGSLDFRLPLLRIFRGLGTNPLFFDNLYAFGFAEAAYFPANSNAPVLPAAGGGLTLTTEVLLHIPVAVTVEYDQGFRGDFGGKADFYATLGVGALSL